MLTALKSFWSSTVSKFSGLLAHLYLKKGRNDAEAIETAPRYDAPPPPPTPIEPSATQAWRAPDIEGLALPDAAHAQMWHGKSILPEPTPQTQTPVPELHGDGDTEYYEGKYNRAHRRALERARKRHDKFVKPQGELPPPIPRVHVEHVEPEPDDHAPTAPVVGDVTIDFDDLPPAFLDKHQTGGDEVLFHESEMWGEFAYRDTILDQLDCYWTYLKRMRQRDPDSYEFYRKLGAHVRPYSPSLVYRESMVMDDVFVDKPLSAEEIERYRKRVYLSPSFLKNRPAFGCIAYAVGPEFDRRDREGRISHDSNMRLWSPKFIYFVKYNNPPPTVERPHGPGNIYKMTVWWDRRDWDGEKYLRKGGAPQDFAVWVPEDGKEIRTLRVLSTKVHHVDAKRKHNGSKDRHKTHIPERKWRIPDHAWAELHGVGPALFYAELFCQSADGIDMAANVSVVRVSVAKGDMVATFGVDIRRTAYFFKDRDIILDHRGKRERVFHMVAPHMRKDGTPVKLHFRGAHKFSWAGYQVSITVPGRDHMILSEFNVGIHDKEQHPKGRKFIDMGSMGDALAKSIAERKGGTHTDPLPDDWFSERAREHER